MYFAMHQEICTHMSVISKLSEEHAHIHMHTHMYTVKW